VVLKQIIKNYTYTYNCNYQGYTYYGNGNTYITIIHFIINNLFYFASFIM